MRHEATTYHEAGRGGSKEVSSPAGGDFDFAKAIHTTVSVPENHEVSEVSVRAESMNALLELTSANYGVISELIDPLLEQRRLEDAQSLLRGLILANPENGAFHVFLGRVLASQHRDKEALEAYDLALLRNPRDVDAYVYRGELHLRCTHLARAKQDFLAAIGLDPEGRNPNSLRAWALRAETTRAQRRVADRAQEASRCTP